MLLVPYLAMFWVVRPLAAAARPGQVFGIVPTGRMLSAHLTKWIELHST